MGDIIKAIEFLGVPATIAITLVGLFLILQILGELCELKGKIVPEFLKVRKYFKRKKQERKDAAETLKEVRMLLGDVNSHYSKDNITKRNQWMLDVDANIAEINKLGTKIDKLLDDNAGFKVQLKQVEDNVLNNEADRLRSELFDCGNRCRRRIRLHPEEMEHIRAVYKKYSEVLHQNGPGEKEYSFIVDYYNKQNFPDYHQKND